MNTSISTHDAKTIKFRAERHTGEYKGGWLSVTVGTGKNEYGTPDPLEFIVHTWSDELFDHFCDIARVASGEPGSLSPKPEGAPQDGNPTER